jgi:hypothetical protein
MIRRRAYVFREGFFCGTTKGLFPKVVVNWIIKRHKSCNFESVALIDIVDTGADAIAVDFRPT